MNQLLKLNYRKQFNLIEIDPPYNIGKDKWDKFKSHKEYLEFIQQVMELSDQLLSDNGTLFLWHNDIKVIADFIHLIKDNTDLKLKQMCTWNKYFKYNDDKTQNNQYGFLNGFIQSDINRSYQKMCEYVLYYTKQDEELTVYNANDPFKKIKDYFYDAKKKANLTTTKLNQLLGHIHAEHTFYTKTQWTFPTKETYFELQKFLDLPIEYNEILKTYENLRYTFNSDKNNFRSCIWNYPMSKETKHKTEKPLQLYYDMFEVHTKPNDKCLFPFVGSGNNLVSLIDINKNDNGNRSFLGFETDEKWFNLNLKRINN